MSIVYNTKNNIVAGCPNNDIIQPNNNKKAGDLIFLNFL